jgi:hypothetical protein
MTIGITTGDSKEVGSCNGCLRFMTPEGPRQHKVYIIDFHKFPDATTGIKIRLCNDCLRELQKKIGSARYI